jgi:hypothetical protein
MRLRWEGSPALRSRHSLQAEITAGGITVALWAGEPFDLRELVGVLLVRSRGLEPHGVTR